MVRQNLAEFFWDYFRFPAEYLVYDDGNRRWTYSYGEVAESALAFAIRLQKAGIAQGERIILWCENRPEWLFAFWGCVLAGIVVVPIGSDASADFVQRIQSIIQPRLILAGDEIPLPSIDLGTPVWRLTAEDWSRRPVALACPDLHRDDLAEILFTSGSTAEPKGVLITHGNLLSQVEAAEPAIRRYRTLVRLLSPLRLLQLLPLSHLFGQAATLLLPPLVSCSVVMTREQAPAALLGQIRERKAIAAVCIPRLLQFLQAYVERSAPEAARATIDRTLFLQRLWRYRGVHRLFGPRFLGFVVGGAALDRQTEDFWSGLGFRVVQGYGLTETSPVVTLNHPFRPRRGSVGKPLPGVDVQIAADGEILVRGENVTPGYYNEPAQTAEAIVGSWLHTGDLGELDRDGYLYIRGRRKEMVVTPGGVNVFPEDIERVVNAQPGVRESAVVAAGDPGQEHIHAVLILERDTDPERIVADANRQLQAYQRIRSFSVWPGNSLPRTHGTLKLKRAEIAQYAASNRAKTSGHQPEWLENEIQSKTGRLVGSDTRIDELGLGSIDRVELLLELEHHYQCPLDEREFAAAETVGDLQKAIRRSLEGPPSGISSQHPDPFPTWNRGWPARLLRHLNLDLWILPLTRLIARPSIAGVDSLQKLRPPVIFAANHQSHIDTPQILAALPRRWRYRVAPAMYKEYFSPHLHPEAQPLARCFLNSLEYYLVTLLFNAFPIPQEEPGARETLRYAGGLVSEGWSLLIFPEGERRSSGQMGRFYPGVGLLALRLKVPLIPIHIENTDYILPRGRALPRFGHARVTFGKPLQLRGEEDPQALAERLQEAIKLLDAGRPDTKQFAA
jgi:long-chain acyl-CoA synthetase